ncbi:MAG: glycosyltransferase family 2 protein [Planctomycetaceae bacterium]
MLRFVDLMLLTGSVVILGPMLVFCLECLASLPWRRVRQVTGPARPRVAVLVPAHNEQAVIQTTLNTLMPTLSAGDWVLVVADNCTDRTAEHARDCGATVVERYDTVHCGKPYALEFGIRELEHNPPDVLVVLDADCQVDPRTIDQIGRLAHQTQRPVQSLNLCHADASAQTLHVVSSLGFRFKNLVRPLGLLRLGLPCHLMGTGMALPWKIVRSASFVGDYLAEDMQLGIELAAAGYPTLFCPSARVQSGLPQQQSAFMTQRTRWEHGHLRATFTQVPRLVLQAVRRRRLGLLCLAADLTVPPFSLLIFIWLVATMLAAAAWLLGASALPALLLAGGGALAGVSIAAAWAAHCRQEIPLAALAGVPAYMIRKLPIYLSFFLFRRQKEWVRTERDPATSGDISSSPEIPRTENTLVGTCRGNMR